MTTGSGTTIYGMIGSGSGTPSFPTIPTLIGKDLAPGWLCVALTYIARASRYKLIERCNSASVPTCWCCPRVARISDDLEPWWRVLSGARGGRLWHHHPSRRLETSREPLRRQEWMRTELMPTTSALRWTPPPAGVDEDGAGADNQRPPMGSSAGRSG